MGNKTDNSKHASSHKWDEDFIWKAYELARSGYKEKDIAGEFDVRKITFWAWKTKHPAFSHAIKAGKAYYKKVTDLSGESHSTNLEEFIYGKLSGPLQETWDYIMAAYKEDADISIAELDSQLEGATMEARQALFLHAWYKCNFSIVEARRMVNIPKKTWEAWQQDPVFIELFSEMDVIKSDFFESSMVNLVKLGNARATVEANEAFNSEKYGKKATVEHSGQIDHRHMHLVSMADLDLPMDVRKEILGAVRKRKALEAGETFALEN